MVAAINERYTEKDIYTARATLPPQRIEHGVVSIELIEGKLGRVNIKKNRYTDDQFLRERVSQQHGQVVDAARLKQDLIYFNRTSDIQLRALMRPGASKGLTRILLLADEPPRFSLVPFVDDAGSKSTGRYRAGMSFEWFSPFGIDDRFDGYFAGARGDLTGYMSYSLPVDRSNGRLGLSYDRSAINIVHGPFRDLDITGHTQNIALDFTQPFLATRHWKLTWASSLGYTKSETKAEGVQYASSNANQLSSGVTLVRSAGRRQWTLTQTLNDVRSAQTLKDKRNFFIYRLRASYLQAFGTSPYSMKLAIGGQYSSADELPSQALFQVGGVYSVRGYVPGTVAGASGFNAQLEFHRRIPKWFDVFAFADTGAVYQAYPSSKHITSAGIGFAFNDDDWLTGSLSLGFPLRTAMPEQDNYRLDFRIAFHWAP
jgi:hemolysin activation/secretion protein